MFKFLVVLTAIVLLRDILLIFGGFVRRYQILEPPVTFQRFFNPSVSSFRVTPSLTSKVNLKRKKNFNIYLLG